MSVHRAVPAVAGDETRLGHLREDVLERAAHDLAVPAASGHVAVGEECDSAERRDAGVVDEASAAERAVGILQPREMLEAARDRFIEPRRHLLDRGCVLRAAEALARRIGRGCRLFRRHGDRNGILGDA